MNNQDRDAIASLELAMKDVQKALEKITTNDLPHITRKLGQVWTLVIFVILPLMLVVCGGVIVKFIVE